MPVLPETERKSIATLPNPTLLLIKKFLKIDFSLILGLIVARFREDAATLLPTGLDDIPICSGILGGEDGRVVVAMVIVMWMGGGGDDGGFSRAVLPARSLKSNDCTSSASYFGSRPAAESPETVVH